MGVPVVHPSPPDPEAATRRRHVSRVAFTALALVVTVMAGVALLQPDLASRAITVTLVVAGLCGVALLLNRAGRSRTASVVLVAGFMTVVLLNALTTGGIRSPGVQALFVMALLTGVLLGFRAALVAAVTGALGGLGLVLLELGGRLPEPLSPYNSLTLWVLSVLYMGLAVLVLRLATSSIAGALARADAELAQRRAAERRLRQALDAGGIGTYDHDLRTFDIAADEGTLRLTGLVPRSDGLIAGEEWRARVHPDDWPRIAADLQRFARGEIHGRNHYRYHHPDGTLRHFDVAAYLQAHPEGRPTGIVGVIMDVTAREQAAEERGRMAEALQERVKELRILHEASQLLQAAREVDAPLLAELARRLPSAFQREDLAEARIVYESIDVATPGWTDSPWRIAAPFRTSDGVGQVEVIYRLAAAATPRPSFLPEERQLLSSLAEMVRARAEERSAEGRRAETETHLRHAQRLDALGRLAGGIAHDFNNLLTAITANAELAILQAPPVNGAHRGLREILTASSRAKDLVKRILLFSRHSETHRTVVELPTLVRETIELLSVSLPGGVTVRFQAETDVPPVLADSSQLHQVLLNLGTNALYAMRETGGVLQFHLSSVELAHPHAGLAAGPYVRIAVRDSGTGIPPEALDRLFEPFFTTKGEAGTGLGLAVVHGIVRDHGGSVTVHSAPGGGTEFLVDLPASPRMAETETAGDDIVRGAGERLLVVDDEPALVGVLSRTLQWIGYECAAFTSPVAALHAYAENPDRFDAVITDRSMAELDGLELVRRLRAIRPELPVAIMSGFAAQDGYPGDLEPILWIDKPSTLASTSRRVRELFPG